MMLFQHRDVTECVRPMFTRILELQDCEDDTLQRDANNIVKSLRSNVAELMGDRLGDYISDFVDKPTLEMLCECIVTPIIELTLVNERMWHERQRYAMTAVFAMSDRYSCLILVQIGEVLKKDWKVFEGRVNELTIAVLDGLEEQHFTNALLFVWEMAKLYPAVSSITKTYR